MFPYSDHMAGRSDMETVEIETSRPPVDASSYKVPVGVRAGAVDISVPPVDDPLGDTSPEPVAAEPIADAEIVDDGTPQDETPAEE
jgi:hypothetical protein